MTSHSLDSMRVTVAAMVAVVVVAVAGLATTDAPALPVGAVFLVLVVVARFSALYRHADAVAALVGSGAYGVLEAGRGGDGLMAWVVATVGFTATAAAVRHTERQARGAEERERRIGAVVEDLTVYDKSSGLLKRRYGEIALEEEVQRARATDTPVTLILVAADPAVDHPVEAPPDVEREAALMGAVFSDNLRVIDRSMRLSSSVFAAILPATGAEGGVVVAGRVREGVTMPGDRPLRCAVATFPDHAVSAGALLEEAEAALRLARTAGMDVISPAMLYNAALGA